MGCGAAAKKYGVLKMRAWTKVWGSRPEMGTTFFTYSHTKCAGDVAVELPWRTCLQLVDRPDDEGKPALTESEAREEMPLPGGR